MRRGRWILVVAVGAVTVPLTQAHTSSGQERSAPAVTRTASASTTSTSTVSTALPGTAAAALAELPRKGRAPRTGYTRAQFGQAWTDDVAVTGGHNGCDTRNDILRRDLTSVRLAPGGCRVLSGVLDDPYTGARIAFTRGPGTSSRVQIDHVVALADAWQKGAQQLSAARRTELANDPVNLLAVDGPTNVRKGAGDAATWLPKATFRCAYVARQIAVKRTYGLWVTVAEGDAMARVLASCPWERLPTGSGVGAPAAAAENTATPATSGGEVYYRSCAAVRQADRAPLRVGQPGYRRALDRDGDGVACE